MILLRHKRQRMGTSPVNVTDTHLFRMSSSILLLQKHRVSDVVRMAAVAAMVVKRAHCDFHQESITVGEPSAVMESCGPFY